MRNTSYPDVSQSKPGKSSINNVVTQQSQTRSSGFFGWWHQLTAPVEPPTSASFNWRDCYRKACLFSNIALFLIATLTLSVYLVLPDPYILCIDCAEIAVSGACLLLNRHGRIWTAGIVQIISLEVAFTCVILIMSPLNDISTQIFDLFIIGELLTALLLPVYYVFLVALYNISFIWFNIRYLSYSPGMPLPSQSQFISIVACTVGLQVIVAVISSIWVCNTNKAIRNGDQVEVVAKLEQTLFEQRKELESDIQQILQTHVSIANGNLNARVPLTKDHILSHIARAFNSLLLRLQRASLSERELHRVEHAVRSTVNLIQKSALERQQARIPFTQTAVDPLIAAIQGKTFAFTKPLQQNNPISTGSINANNSSRQIPTVEADPE